METMMEERPFCNKAFEPTDDNLNMVLASTFSYYNQLLEHAEGFSRKWNYSKSSGWMQKVFDRKKALFYVIPLANQFQISMAVREAEREILLTDRGLDFAKEQLRQAKKYNEGYAMRYLVVDAKSSSRTILFIKKLIALRK